MPAADKPTPETVKCGNGRTKHRGRQVGTWRTYDRAGNVLKETASEG